MSIIIPPNAGEKIKLIRKTLGMNQKDFGELIGVRQASVSDYERGEISPSKAVWASLVYRYSDIIEGKRAATKEPNSDNQPANETDQLIEMAIKVLESDSEISQSLAMTIRGFFALVENRNQLAETHEKLTETQEKLEATRSELSSIRTEIDAIRQEKELLKSGTESDAHQCCQKDRRQRQEAVEVDRRTGRADRRRAVNE